MNQLRRIACFDIDGTVFRSSLLIELVERFIQEGVFPAEAAEGYAEAYERWVAREGGYEAYIGAVVEVFLHHLKGVHYGTFADIGRTVVAEQEKRVYRYARDLITQLRFEGFYLVAVSQSPKTVLDDFCQAYGFDKVYGRIYEIGPQDRFTGAVSQEHLIQNKANIYRRVLDRTSGVTGDGSVAVGDTEGDIPLLEAITRPICFNPNRLLYEHALRMGWEVVVERKDVVYELN